MKDTHTDELITVTEDKEVPALDFTVDGPVKGVVKTSSDHTGLIVAIILVVLTIGTLVFINFRNAKLAAHGTN